MALQARSVKEEAKRLGEKLSVFYCIDEYSKLPDVDGAAVQKMDDDLTAAADIVFACNQKLIDAVPSLAMVDVELRQRDKIRLAIHIQSKIFRDFLHRILPDVAHHQVVEIVAQGR